MCLILFAYQYHAEYPLVVAANRDEYYARPTQTADFWKEAPDIFAGKDLQAGGTWMGISKQGRFAAVTNFREPKEQPDNAISRGELCKNFLLSQADTKTFTEKIDQHHHLYAGFNLLLGEPSDTNTLQLSYYSNRTRTMRPLAPGIYGLSNGLLNDPWPKVTSGKAALQNILDNHEQPSSSALRQLLDLLLDQHIAQDDDLPSTGINLEMERALSSRFIRTPEYGTRTTTVLRLDNKKTIDWMEQHHDQHGPCSEQTKHTFTLG